VVGVAGAAFILVGLVLVVSGYQLSKVQATTT